VSDTGTYQIPRALLRPSPVEDAGGVRFDDRGNAVWTPRSGVDSNDALRRLLNHPSLAIVPDATGPQQKIATNPRGLRAGYDPYDSGRLDKRKRQGKKDLGRLSEWIVNNRKADSSDKD
jgi:hypothetical protein